MICGNNAELDINSKVIALMSDTWEKHLYHMEVIMRHKRTGLQGKTAQPCRNHVEFITKDRGIGLATTLWMGRLLIIPLNTKGDRVGLALMTLLMCREVNENQLTSLAITILLICQGLNENLLISLAITTLLTCQELNKNLLTFLAMMTLLMSREPKEDLPTSLAVILSTTWLLNGRITLRDLNLQNLNLTMFFQPTMRHREVILRECIKQVLILNFRKTHTEVRGPAIVLMC